MGRKVGEGGYREGAIRGGFNRYKATLGWVQMKLLNGQRVVTRRYRACQLGERGLRRSGLVVVRVLVCGWRRGAWDWWVGSVVVVVVRVITGGEGGR